MSICENDIIVDKSGKTILHKIALKLDLNKLKIFVKNYPEKVLKMINMSDKKGCLPIHYALKTIKKHKSNDYSFIMYIINVLHAKIDIPDNNGRIIVATAQNDNSLLSDSLSSENNITTDLNVLDEMIIENEKNLLNKTNFNNIKSSNITDMEKDKKQQIDFVISLIDTYNKNVKNDVSGGYSGRRFIQQYKLESSDDDFDTSDSFLQGNEFVDRYSNDFPMERQHRKTDPELNKRYRDLLEQIMKLLEKDENEAKTFRSLIKLTITDQDPMLKKFENEEKKIKMMEEIVSSKKNLQDFIKKNLPDSTIKALKDRMKKQAELGEERRKSRDNSSNKSESNDSKKTKESKPKESKTKEKESKKQSFKKKNKSKLLNEDGYLQSSEIILSSD